MFYYLFEIKVNNTVLGSTYYVKGEKAYAEVFDTLNGLFKGVNVSVQIKHVLPVSCTAMDVEVPFSIEAVTADILPKVMGKIGALL